MLGFQFTTHSDRLTMGYHGVTQMELEIFSHSVICSKHTQSVWKPLKGNWDGVRGILGVGMIKEW